MDKKKRQLIITGVLLVVMVILMGKALFRGKKGSPAFRVVSSQSSVSLETMATNMAFLASVRQSESMRLLQEAEWQKPWGRDPFDAAEALDAKTGGSSSFSLSGIVWDEKMPVAIINDKLLQTGDQIDGCQVKEIRRSSVSLVCDGASQELKLFRTAESGEPESK